MVCFFWVRRLLILLFFLYFGLLFVPIGTASALSLGVPVSHAFTFAVGARYAHRSASATLTSAQRYMAGYDVGNYGSLFGDQGVGAIRYREILYPQGARLAAVSYLLDHIVPSQVMNVGGAAVDLPSADVPFWLYGVAGGDYKRSAKSERLVEAEGGAEFSAPSAGLSFDLNFKALLGRFVVGAWASYVYYFSDTKSVMNIASSVATGDETLVGEDVRIESSREALGYAPFSFKMLESTRAQVRWKDYGRFGFLAGYTLSADFSCDVRFGVRYVLAEMRLGDLSMGYPYAHKTYRASSVMSGESNPYWMNVSDMLLKGGGWGIVLGAALNFRISPVQGVSVSVEFAPVELDVSWKSSRNSDELAVQSPKERLGFADCQSPDGWHMTYVDSLSLKTVAKLRISEFSIGAEYSLRV